MSAEAESDVSSPPPRRARPWMWVGIAFALLLVLLAAAGAWLLKTESGAQWIANRAVGALGGKLEIREVHGTVVGPLSAGGVRWHDVDHGVDVRVERASVDVALRELLARRVRVVLLDVGGVDVRLSEPKKKKEEPSEFSLEPPIDMVLDRFSLKDAQVSRNGASLFVARTAEAVGSWTRSRGVVIQKLVVDSPDGNVHLAGEVDEQGSYVGRASGGFRWTLAQRQFAGDLSATSEKEQLHVQLQMTAPFAAHLDATLGETKKLPWKLSLDAPKFDPREQLLPGSSLESLEATVRGEGDLTVAEVNGEVGINGQRLRIEPLRVRLKDKQVLEIENVNLIDPGGRGKLNAIGDVRFGAAAADAARTFAASQAATAARERGNAVTKAAPDGTASRADAVAAANESATGPPFFANLAVQWQGVELPREWVGQPLATHGGLKVVGFTETFTADGELSLGPPGHLAEIALAVAGTPERIAVKRFTILQERGSLNATGTVGLKPQIDWQITARATRFNPGAFLAAWPGSLGFDLDSKGRITPQGPSASLDLKDLDGTLRARAIAGQAALTLSPNKVVAGNLRLSSGASTVSITGRGGKTLDVDTEINVASLEDWVPKSAGRLSGKFHIAGTWPRLAVNGNAHGRQLALAGYTVRAVDVDADVQNPQSPSGSVKLTATEILAKGFTFSRVELNASGDEKNHSADLTATGQPLTAQVRAHGARQGDGWSGSVDQLTFAAVGIEPLTLRQPAQVSWSPKGFSVTESCLAGEHISACAAASQSATGELNAKYQLEHLPLGLIAALAVPNLPMRIEAVIEGDGNLRRAPDGALFGQVRVSSASGRISDAAAAAQEDAADALLTYENLKLEATLAGDTAHSTLQASLGGSGGGKGTLDGKVALTNLRGSSPSLDGNATLSIADLSPVGLFVPQLSEVHGRGDANVEIGGTLANPRITGKAQLLELSAEVPQVGIKLHDGELHAALDEQEHVALNGKVSSGDGQLTLNGNTTAERVLQVKVQGKDFVAANIPGAKVTIEPDLDFERSKEHMTLGGTVTIPKADIDVSKLPRQGSVQHASADVVVVDDEKAIEQAKNVPLEVKVTVKLGKDVALIGYGLNAKVDGQILVHEVQGETTTGSGEVRVNGTYKAYGQDLTIQQGRLLFAGQAISDPQVNITATRTVDTTTAKLTVTGSAQKPLLEVSSDPPLPQTQALSYLVAGKPLNEVGSGEGDMVQSAARSLGGAAGNLVAKGLGKHLGLDQVGVEDSPEIGGAAFTVGQYLSPRLYLSYGVGLFEPGQVVTLRYRLSEKLSVEAIQGTLSQKAGINYRIEK